MNQAVRPAVESHPLEPTVHHVGEISKSNLHLSGECKLGSQLEVACHGLG